MYSFRVQNQALASNVEMRTDLEGYWLVSAFNTDKPSIKFVVLDVAKFVQD